MSEERRRYIRISTVLPIEFFVFDREGKRITPWLQGFTQDISKGGLCLLINDLWWGFWDRFHNDNVLVSLKIHLPFKKNLLSGKAKVAWVNQKKLKDFNQYVVGLEFLQADKKKAANLFKYALLKKSLPLFVGGVIIILSLFSFSSFRKAKILIKENKNLVKEYVDILQRNTALGKIYENEKEGALHFRKRQKQMQERIDSKNKEVSRYQKNYESLLKAKLEDQLSLQKASQLKEKISLLQEELTALKKENEALKVKEQQRDAAALGVYTQTKSLVKEKLQFSQEVIKGMYMWIKNRQDLIGGLVLSYEGDRDLERVCFSYDQAVAAIVFLLFDDVERAAKILDFYLEKVKKGEDIYNAYYTGGGVFEYTSHSGPCAWVGISALNYVKKTGDKKYLLIARKVNDFLLVLADKEGGIRGGPELSWYSTEHNLDAFAFFSLFYQVTKEVPYLETAEKIKQWLSRHAYTQHGPPVKRGKGDATIATDTYAWSVTSLGPENLFSLKMNPETILEFAVENCEVEVEFDRPEGKITVQGFDFAKFRNVPQGGVISCEWTAQMILAFQIMADYYEGKDSSKYEEYLRKTFFYFEELQKMLITSPSRAGRVDPCLPYASSPFVDTGHGWRTPKGNRTGSLASTAYFLISYFGYNPLKGDFLTSSLRKSYEEELNKIAPDSN